MEGEVAATISVWESIWGWITSIDVVGVATVVTLVFVAWQTILLRKTYQYNCDWQGKGKAADLAVVYKDDIIPGISYIGAVLKRTNIMTVLGNICSENIDQFNQLELFRLTGAEIKNRVEEKKHDRNTIEYLLRIRKEYSQIYNQKLHDVDPILVSKWYKAKAKEKDKNGNTIVMSQQEEETLLRVLWVEYEAIKARTLNNLEYFAMNFISGVADEAVVFQSLHQTYLSIIEMLYYDISIKNIHEKDKYYTNAIALYKIWREKDFENERKINEAIAKATPVRK